MPKIHKTANYIRERQISPKRFDPRSFRTKSIGKKGDKIVVGCLKGNYDNKRKKCKVGLKTQTLLRMRK